MPLGFRPLGTAYIGRAFLPKDPRNIGECFVDVVVAYSPDAENVLGDPMPVALACTMDAEILAAPGAEFRPSTWKPEAPATNFWIPEAPSIANPRS